MTGVLPILIGVTAVAAVLIAAAVRILREYERGVIFRLGRLLGAKGPGLILLIPVIDRMVRVDLRTVTLNIPPQEIITRDNVPARVNAVAYFRVLDPVQAIVNVEDYLAPLRRSRRRPFAPSSARPISTRFSPSASGSMRTCSRSSTSRPSPGE